MLGALPLVLSSAPREFTKVLAPILALLRTQGIKVTWYVDDLLKDSSPFQLSANVHRTIQILQAFRWVIGFQKSAFQNAFA